MSAPRKNREDARAGKTSLFSRFRRDAYECSSCGYRSGLAGRWFHAIFNFDPWTPGLHCRNPGRLW